MEAQQRQDANVESFEVALTRRAVQEVQKASQQDTEFQSYLLALASFDSLSVNQALEQHLVEDRTRLIKEDMPNEEEKRVRYRSTHLSTLTEIGVKKETAEQLLRVIVPRGISAKKRYA